MPNKVVVIDESFVAQKEERASGFVVKKSENPLFNEDNSSGIVAAVAANVGDIIPGERLHFSPMRGIAFVHNGVHYLVFDLVADATVIVGTSPTHAQDNQ